MTNNQIALIKRALLEEELAEMAVIDALPDEEVSFSEKYKTEMHKLLDKYKKRTYNVNRRISKRLVGALAAILIALTLMMSISAIREPIIKFIVNVYDNFISVFIEEDDGAKPPETIEKIYLPSCEIDGFNFQSTTNYSTIIKTKWINANGNLITLEQLIIKDNYQAFLDNESKNYEITEINSFDIYYINKNNHYFTVWSNGEYMFKMLFPNTIEFSEIEKSLESMEAVEN